VNDGNEILMQRRNLSKDKFPGLWDLSVASHVQSGENSWTTILRETNEEVGIQIGFRVEVRDFRFITSFRDERIAGGGIIEKQYYDLFMLRRDIELEKFSFNDSEVAEVKWVDYTGLMKMKDSGVMYPRLQWIGEILSAINRL
jgi:isopentenyldiphosphate isomerase